MLQGHPGCRLWPTRESAQAVDQCARSSREFGSNSLLSAICADPELTRPTRDVRLAWATRSIQNASRQPYSGHILLCAHPPALTRPSYPILMLIRAARRDCVLKPSPIQSMSLSALACQRASAILIGMDPDIDPGDLRTNVPSHLDPSQYLAMAYADPNPSTRDQSGRKPSGIADDSPANGARPLGGADAPPTRREGSERQTEPDKP